MIKKYNEFVSTELDNFYEDLNVDNLKIKLFCKFSAELDDLSNLDDSSESFDMGIPEKKFQPKTKTYNPSKNKKDNNKSVF